ncbi:MAG: hypothetical protein K5986_06705 [Clostridium sp.]|uniref:TolB family protein n=1 Tax=Clostridium sp. DSM 8431 TaxID=1761781 RepID=UPI0008E1E9AE|nr:hypothetical protein [Clostridium sp. DSM 8431]MCR4944135.1 hypothetical protein [Clostridium sp.]SFU72027.1 hypothetical protein SAMN04487886_11183 [Clostridium sp. DSM 8431]
MKGKKIQLLIKIMIPAVIIGAGFGGYKILNDRAERSFNKTVVVNDSEASYIDENDSSLEILSKEAFGDVEGFSGNYGFINDNEVLIGIGLSKEEFFEKYPDEIDKTDDDLFWQQQDDQYGKLYVYNLKDSSKRLLNTKVRDMFSDSALSLSKYAYINGDNVSIFDIVKNSEVGHIDGDVFKNYDYEDFLEPESSMWSKDGSTLISYDNENLVLYNVEENSIKKIKVDNGERHVSILPSYYSEDGKEVYFVGTRYKKNIGSQGIYKINVDTESIEEVFSLPYVDHSKHDYSKYSGIQSNDYCVLDDGKRIIFNGTIEGIDGTYIYNMEEEKFYNVIPNKVKSERGSYSSTIWVSPDKTKVVYMDLVKEEGEEQWNLYAANINGNNLTNRICIYNNIKQSRLGIKWSSDSKKIIFFTTDSFTTKNYISIADKNEVNIITFK